MSRVQHRYGIKFTKRSDYNYKGEIPDLIGDVVNGKIKWEKFGLPAGETSYRESSLRCDFVIHVAKTDKPKINKIFKSTKLKDLGVSYSGFDYDICPSGYSGKM